MSEEISNFNNELASDDNERIGFGPRIGAYALDLVINIIVGAIIGAVLGATLLGLFFPDQVSPEGYEGAELALEGFTSIMGGIVGSMAGVYLMYIVMFLIEGATGQSVGKMILKIKNANEDGSKATAGTLWIRALIKYSSMVLALLAGITGIVILGTVGSIAGLAIFIGCFFVLGDKRQAFQDMIAKTAVYKK